MCIFQKWESKGKLSKIRKHLVNRIFYSVILMFLITKLDTFDPFHKLQMTNKKTFDQHNFYINLSYRQDNYIYLINKCHNYWFMTKKVTFSRTVPIHENFTTQTFLEQSVSVHTKQNHFFLLQAVISKSWRPQHFRTPWHYNMITEFEGELFLWN